MGVSNSKKGVSLFGTEASKSDVAIEDEVVAFVKPDEDLPTPRDVTPISVPVPRSTQNSPEISHQKDHSGTLVEAETKIGKSASVVTIISNDFLLPDIAPTWCLADVRKSNSVISLHGSNQKRSMCKLYPYFDNRLKLVNVNRGIDRIRSSALADRSPAAEHRSIQYANRNEAGLSSHAAGNGEKLTNNTRDVPTTLKGEGQDKAFRSQMNTTEEGLLVQLRNEGLLTLNELAPRRQKQSDEILNELRDMGFVKSSSLSSEAAQSLRVGSSNHIRVPARLTALGTPHSERLSRRQDLDDADELIDSIDMEFEKLLDCYGPNCYENFLRHSRAAQRNVGKRKESISVDCTQLGTSEHNPDTCAADKL